jgi:hypothetical protein
MREREKETGYLDGYAMYPFYYSVITYGCYFVGTSGVGDLT